MISRISDHYTNAVICSKIVLSSGGRELDWSTEMFKGLFKRPSLEHGARKRGHILLLRRELRQP